MAGPLVKVDVKKLDAFAKKLKKASSKDVTKFLEKCAKELAKRLLRRTIQKTPKDLGNLQRGWTAKPGTPPCREYKQKSTPEQWAQTALITRSGKETRIVISNPIEYAVYVEYGHRTRDLTGWVPGQFMLTLSIEELDSMKNGILEKLLTDFLSELFK